MVRGILWYCLHFPQRAKSLTLNCLFSHVRTLTPTNTPSHTASTDDITFYWSKTAGFKIILWLLHTTVKRVEEVEWSSLTFRDWTVNSWHVSQLIPFLQGGSIAFLCHWKLSITTGRHACLATTEKHWYYYRFFDCLFLVTEFFLWITVLVILLYFCQRCSVSRGAHKDLTMFRLSCVQVIIILTDFTWSLEAPVNLVVSSPLPHVHWCWTMCRHIEFLLSLILSCSS